MEDKEYNNIYAIPPNYTDSGKIFGGMLELRNTIEAIIVVGLLGYPELVLIPMSATMRIVLMTVTLIPIGVVALMGIDGDSLFQYILHIINFLTHKRNLHFRRIGYEYDEKQLRKSKKRKEKTA